MRITPFRVLEAYARKEYQQRMAEMPEPKLINGHAAASLHAPRSFVWGGIGYWAPPLSYEAGKRLMVAAHALPIVQRTGNQAAQVRATRTIARLLRQLVYPQRRLRRLIWRLGRNPFTDAPAEALGLLLRGLLFVEDESPSTMPSAKVASIDLVADLYAFRALYHCEPRSWADYIYGMRHMARHGARDDLRTAIATRVAQYADKKGWREYERDQLTAAGWN